VSEFTERHAKLDLNRWQRRILVRHDESLSVINLAAGCRRGLRYVSCASLVTVSAAVVGPMRYDADDVDGNSQGDAGNCATPVNFAARKLALCAVARCGQLRFFSRRVA